MSSNDPLTIIHGDALSSLREMESESVQCCVTSPPYWGLRDYGVDPIVWDETVECEHDFIETRQCQDSPIRSGGEGVGFHDAETTKAQRWRTHGTCSVCSAWRGCLGLEPTPDLFVSHIVQIFREMNRVLRRDATVWLNLGDSYCANGKGGRDEELRSRGKNLPRGSSRWGGGNNEVEGLKTKDLIGIPWLTAFALRSDGWYLRSDVVWSKPNPMPESVTDRPTKSHEYIFLLSKSERYYYDAVVIQEEAASGMDLGLLRGKGDGNDPRVAWHAPSIRARQSAGVDSRNAGTGWRNKRSVWTVATMPFPDAHFATFPPDLIKPCILAGSKPGDVVIDPFGGSGTTGKVAIELGRKAILIEPKAEYIEMIKRRCQTTIGLPLAI